MNAVVLNLHNEMRKHERAHSAPQETRLRFRNRGRFRHAICFNLGTLYMRRHENVPDPVKPLASD